MNHSKECKDEGYPEKLNQNPGLQDYEIPRNLVNFPGFYEFQDVQFPGKSQSPGPRNFKDNSFSSSLGKKESATFKYELVHSFSTRF